MHEEILYENKLAVIHYNQQPPYIKLEVKKYMNSEQFREASEKVIQFYKSRRDKLTQLHFVADTRKQGVTSKEDQNWLNEYWNIEMYKLGLRKIAFIIPEGVFGQLSVNNYVDKTKKQNEKYLINTAVFPSLEAVQNWLSNDE